jgi:alpha,alpha-trehalase
MAPLLNHPPGLNFVGDPQHEERPIDADPSVYYGGTEYHSRSRTYSTVSVHL